MKATQSGQFLRATVGAAAILASGVATTRADLVEIFDLTPGGTPTVKVLDTANNDITASRLTLLPDTGPNFLHFNLENNFTLGSGSFGYTDFFDDSVGGTLSNRLLFFIDANPANGIDVKFGSSPNIPSIAGLSPLFHTSDDAVENGALQPAGDVFITNLGDGTYHFFVQSDNALAAAIPEPASLALVGVGAVLILGSRRRGKK